MSQLKEYVHYETKLFETTNTRYTARIATVWLITCDYYIAEYGYR